ncbi:methyltransferase domain-containing protein [Streptomyces sp. NBC_01343]|uniref:class I SAM-dependent methyltransferase n=1 Tax=Streptomyces sp. NBC_01343 TaxID=2903832 RepID=UPI002E130178|nr:methyltransferase domain-containing protein [Streptomyces sp. NBC_01343]
MNAFADVDRSGRGPELLRYLDDVHRGLIEPKNVMRAGLAVKPGHRVLDLGCGAGHELVELERAGRSAFGVDSGSVMLEASRLRLGAHGLPVRLVHADAHDLPFADASFAGCRIERASGSRTASLPPCAPRRHELVRSPSAGAGAASGRPGPPSRW